MKTSLILAVLRISLWYTLFGVLWILLTDTILLVLVDDLQIFIRLQLYKGWFFVLLSALLIFGLLRHHLSIREEAERELQENEERYRLLFENSLDAILLTAPDGRIFSANPAACRMFERTEEEIRRVGRSGLVDVADPRLTAALEERTRTGSFSGELTFVRKGGVKFPGEISTSVFLNRDGQERTSVIIRDITERKQAEESLCKSEEFQRAIVACSPVALFSIDPDGQVLTWNDSAERIFGWTAGEVIGNPLPIVPYDKKEEFTNLRRMVIEGRSFSALELVRRRKDGDLIHVSLSTAPIHDADGKVIGIMAAMEDITERKKSEAERDLLTEQLRQAQKMEAIGLLAGGIAHDFNNILNAIIGFGSILQSRMAPEDPLRVNVDEILGAAERATQLTHGLLAFSRKQVINLKPVDLCEVVQRMTPMLHRVIGEDIELRMACAEEAIFVLADSGQIEQVLLNLATNARDAMPRGGILSMKVERFKMDDAFLKAHGYGKSGQYAVLSVSDTGFGMDEETRKRIFEPFFTTKETGKGTGLGLATVYGIVKQHEGFINVYSEPGKGTTFRIYLPAAEEPAGVEERKAPPDYPAGGTETILVAEDDPTLRKLTSTVLMGSGYTVILAEDGEDAVLKFNDNKDKIDLVLLDMIMPKKTGLDAYEEIKKLKPDVRALFVSGYTAETIREKGLPGEGLDIVMKPILPRDLLRKVREVLDRSRS